MLRQRDGGKSMDKHTGVRVEGGIVQVVDNLLDGRDSPVPVFKRVSPTLERHSPP